MTLIEGYKILEDILKTDRKHTHYKRVNDLNELYKQIVTGENIEVLLTQFARREDEDLFKQRKRLTQVITPAISATIMSPFYKVSRINSIIKKLKGKNLIDVEKGINEYAGVKTLDRYLENRLIELNFIDPNAFIVTEFDSTVDEQGNLTEKVKPRPFEVSSEEAVDYLYDNLELQYLVVCQGCKYEVKRATGGIIVTEEKDGHTYTIYLKDNAIKFTQVDDEVPVREGEYSVIITQDGEVKYYRSTKNKVYMVEEFEYNIGFVPAVQVGYKRDLITNSKTYVSPMHDAMPYLKKTIKVCSELDLTMALHAFPQKFQYVNACPGEKGLTCNGGMNPDGNTCTKCNGSGIAVHTTTQDLVYMRMPSPNKRKDEMIDLSGMVHYERPPIDILTFQNDYLFQLEAKARQSVFNSEMFDSKEVKTATEFRISLESVYDTLFPFAEQFSYVYKHIVKTIAKLVDVSDLEVEHRFPKDLKFKTTDDLLAELKAANESNAPSYIKKQLSMSIASQLYIDQPEEVNKIMVKQMFFPFPDKTPTDIALIIGNNMTSEYNKTLWANFDNIFTQIESESPDFYSLSYELQKKIVDEKVNGMITPAVVATSFGSTSEE